MDILIANVLTNVFKMEQDLSDQSGAVPLPFYGMDKSMAAVCHILDLKTGLECDKGPCCPFRHIRGDRTIVCKHWLRGLCKKGDQCEFLHEYDMKKMPECYFYSRFNACHNKECPFLHIDPESKIKDCPWYDRGFCRHGPHCRHRHVRRVLCMSYLSGFCTTGWNCKYMHPLFELPAIADICKENTLKKIPTCHSCGEQGHKASLCKTLREQLYENENKISCGINKPNFIGTLNSSLQSDELIKQSNNAEESLATYFPNMPKITKPLEEITCFKCGYKGHYANKCPKGHLAFLSNQRSHK